MDPVLDVRELHQRNWDEHAAILNAIVEGDVALAEILARDHAGHAGQETWQRLRSRPVTTERAGAAA